MKIYLKEIASLIKSSLSSLPSSLRVELQLCLAFLTFSQGTVGVIKPIKWKILCPNGVASNENNIKPKRWDINLLMKQYKEVWGGLLLFACLACQQSHFKALQQIEGLRRKVRNGTQNYKCQWLFAILICLLLEGTAFLESRQ